VGTDGFEGEVMEPSEPIIVIFLRWLLGFLFTLPLWAPGPVTVCATGCNYTDLQKAVDDAIAGWHIQLRAGETYLRGPGLPLKLDNDLAGWVYIESSRLAEMRPGYRVFPRDAALMPRIVSSDTGNGSVIVTRPGAHHWALAGLEISWAGPGQTNDGDLIWLGNTYDETRADQTSHHFLIDRCYIHGFPFDQGPQRAITPNVNQLTVSNSYLSEIHINQGGSETHLIALASGGEDVLIINNSLIGGSEGTLTGGGRDQVNNRRPRNVRSIGNYYFFPGEHITYNFEHDPEGNAPPAPATTLQRTQTFLDLDGADNQTGTADDYTFLVWSPSGTPPPEIGGFWRKVGQPAGKDERRYFPGSLWRNQSNGTIWKANAEGTRYVAGAEDILMPTLAKPITAVTPGNPTVLTLTYGCFELFLGNCSNPPNNLMRASMQFSGATGSWGSLNGKKLPYLRVSSNQISIPFDSTGLPATGFGPLTGTPQFLWWPQKNGAEWKTGMGTYFEANTIRNRWPITFGNQKGYGFLWNWITDQDGPNATLRYSYFRNNKVIDTVTGAAQGNIQADYQIPDTKIVPGNPTKINVGGGMFMRRGEQVFLSQGTGAWADVEKPTPFAIVKGHNEGLPSGELWISYDSTGKSPTGQKLRVVDSSHLKPSGWFGDIVIENNLFDIGSSPTVTAYGMLQVHYDTGSSASSQVVGQSFAFMTTGTIAHNTVVRRTYGPEFLPQVFLQTTKFQIHNRTGPADAIPAVQVNILDNLDDGTGGRFVSDQNSSDGCNDAVKNYWGVNGSQLVMKGNVSHFAGVWQSGITAAEYSGPVCGDGIVRLWGREGGFATQETDGTVAVSGGVATFGWKAAARLLPGGVFCVTSSAPANLKGCWRVPAGVTETATSWKVSVPGVPDGTYTGVAVSSGVGYLDYANRNYRLHPESPVRSLAHDGSDPGADLDVIDWSTEANESGVPNPYLTTHIRDIAVTGTTAVVCYAAYDAAPATVTVATSRKYDSDAGADEAKQKGREGCITVAGLKPGTHYYVRLHTAGRYRDTMMDGRVAEFTTK
jgi:hypothetical protein